MEGVFNRTTVAEYIVYFKRSFMSSIRFTLTQKGSLSGTKIKDFIRFTRTQFHRNKWSIALFVFRPIAGFCLCANFSASSKFKTRWRYCLASVLEADSVAKSQSGNFPSTDKTLCSGNSLARWCHQTLVGCKGGVGMNSTTSKQLGSWSTPVPLPNSLPAVEPFHEDLLPLALRRWVLDIAFRMQCPPDFTAVAAIVGCSSLIGARAVIQPKILDDWRVVPNLWGLAIGRSGVKKSAAVSEALKPLFQLEAQEFKRAAIEKRDWQSECDFFEVDKENKKKTAKILVDKDPIAARALLEPLDMPVEPKARRLIVNDVTVEKLGELLQQNPFGLLSYRDEIYGLLTALDKPGQEGARAFTLQSFDGNQPYTFDRVGRGTIHIPRVCLAMIGGIQPGRILDYFRDAVACGSADDGLLQRFGMTVWPDVNQPYIYLDQSPDASAKLTAWAVFERLAKLSPATENEPVVWRFDTRAQALFVQWLTQIENEIRREDLHPALVSHFSKYRKLIPALALVFALVDEPKTDNLIGEIELKRAIALGSLFALSRQQALCICKRSGSQWRGDFTLADT